MALLRRPLLPHRPTSCTRLCRGATGVPDARHDPRLEAEAEAQKRLMEASSKVMTIDYCRENASSRVLRWLRGTPIDVNYDFRRWRKHQVASRHLQLWSLQNIFRWDLIRRLLFPDLAWIGTTSSLLCYYNVCSGGLLSLPMETITMPSLALGLLITFKTQTGYSRFVEGRNLWGTLINESRALTSRILMRVCPPHGCSGDAVGTAQQHAVKLVRSFATTLKYHLTEDGCNPHIQLSAAVPEDEVRAATALALRAELQGIWDVEKHAERDFVERILAGGNRPLHVLHALEHLNSSVFSKRALGGLDAVAASEIDRSLTVFQNVLGASEKILRTPIYTPYTRFTSRFLFVWCNALPFAMYPLVGPAVTVPVTVFISFFMLGVEDIGSRVEQPFDVMPLWQYCETVDKSCLQLLQHSKELGQLAGPGAEALESEDNKRIRAQLGPLLSSLSM